MYKHFFKRFFDILFSFIGIVVASIPMLIICVAVKCSSKGPVIFKQDRIGKNGKVYKIWKFRSMKVGAEKTGSGVYSGKGDPRVTKIGRILRATSLDEIPQLFNIFSGKMSFIGPRPPLTYHPWPYETYTEEQKKMFNVRPGITGWAQVNGRKEVEWNKRIQLNVWYVEHLSFWLDLKIVFKTIGKVFTNANNQNVGATVVEKPSGAQQEVAVTEQNGKDQNKIKLMYITNNPEIAKIAEDAGVDRIFIDMEYIGKAERQFGLNTVQSQHTIEDIRAVRQVVTRSEILVRCNPIHSATEEYVSSKEEIDNAIEAGADILMLPYFKTVEEVRTFIRLVDGRVKTMPLVETPEAVACIDEILNLDGIDEILVGLNDLSLGYGKKFMFELLSDGTVESLCKKFKHKGIKYGFGGIASLGKGLLKSELVISEHYRLGSTISILSRSFCNTNVVKDLDKIKKLFDKGLLDIREFEQKCLDGEIDFVENKKQVKEAVEQIVNKMEKE